MRLHVIIVQISADFGRSIFILISDNPRFYIQNSCYEHNIPTRTELSQWRKCSFSHDEILNNHHLLGKGKNRKKYEKHVYELLDFKGRNRASANVFNAKRKYYSPIPDPQRPSLLGHIIYFVYKVNNILLVLQSGRNHTLYLLNLILFCNTSSNSVWFIPFALHYLFRRTASIRKHVFEIHFSCILPHSHSPAILFGEFQNNIKLKLQGDI